MSANRYASVVMSVVGVALVGGFGWQWIINTELREAIARLELQQSGTLAPASGGSVTTSGGANERRSVRTVGEEMAEMREEIERLKARTQAVARLAVKNVDGPALLNLRPASGWKNSGRGDPSATVETLLWAADGGDVDALAASILLDEEARAKAQAILDRMPDSVRATYGTPEKLIALLMARDADIRAMQVLSENQSNNDAVVNLRLQKGDGKTKDEGYVLRRDGNEWRMVVPGKAVDKFGKKLSEPTKKGG